MDQSKILEVRNIQKKYGEALFAPVTFDLCRGEGIAVYGHNGSGKTTLLDIIAGLCKPDSGGCKIFCNIGYFMQNDGLQDSLSCRDNLLLEAAMSGLSGDAAKRRAYDCAYELGVTAYWNKRLSKCSAGMRARVALAAALIPAPGLLLLDEAFSALDQDTRTAVKDLLFEKKNAGLSFVMVSHDKEDFAGLCERTLCLPGSGIVNI